MSLQIVGRVSLFVAISVIIFHGLCLAMEVNEFYVELVRVVKSGDSDGVERMVKQHSEVAQECLKVLRQKVARETAPDRAAGFQVLIEELKEAQALAAGGQDCEEAAELVQRGEQSAIPEVKMTKFARALRLCPSNIEARVGQGDLYRSLGRFIPAVKSYEATLEMSGEDSRALMGLGITLYGSGLYRRSLPFFQKLLELDSANRQVQAYYKIVTGRIDRDTDRIINSEELTDLLWNDGESNLMCMCPYYAKLNARVRLRTVTFPVDSWSLSAQARKQLEELAAALGTPGLRDGYYLIEGHSDSTGKSGYNEWLSLQRARAVKRYLVRSCGLSEPRLGIAGMGENRPWTSNHTSGGRRSNRRIEVLSIVKPENDDSSQIQQSEK